MKNLLKIGEKVTVIPADWLGTDPMPAEIVAHNVDGYEVKVFDGDEIYHSDVDFNLVGDFQTVW